jgi:hypothetical protein
MHSSLMIAAFCTSLCACLAAGEVLLRNPTAQDRQDELIRVPAGVAAPGVLVDGAPAPVQVVDGEAWICVRIPAKSRVVVSPGARVSAAPARVAVRREDEDIILDNGLIAVRVPASGGGAPVTALRDGGDWVVRTWWDKAPTGLDHAATVVADGAVFGQVRLAYSAPGGAAGTVDVVVAPGRRDVEIRESWSLRPGDGWRCDLAAGWPAVTGRSAPFAKGVFSDPDGAQAPAPVRPLVPGGHPWQDPALFLRLRPAWTQASWDGWFVAAAGPGRTIGAMPLGAGTWRHGLENVIDARVQEDGRALVLALPAHRGARRWLLTAGVAEDARDYALRRVIEPLDKLQHELVLTWGDQAAASGFFPWDDAINPSGGLRQRGKTLLAQGVRPGTVADLALLQALMHPDTWPGYRQGWSPQNPNFNTDWLRVVVLLAARLKQHPDFPGMRSQVEALVRADVDHAVTLPGGAGQECPGYLASALKLWHEIAPVCRDHLGFDPLTWERIAAAQGFLLRISQPDGAVRRMLPIGDTHPGKSGDGPGIVSVDPAVVAGWTSAELPGFGAILQHRPGTADETYLAFKAGPNRGHYHGDHLAIHLALGARAVAVDHHCSYKPRAGQEAMHNRLSFALPELPSANMDGFERLIAFQTGAVADIAVAEVASPRLRAIRPLPPERWHQTWPRRDLAGDGLTYRRSVALVKGVQDAVVVVDDWRCGEALTATWNLHVRAAGIVAAAAVATCDDRLAVHRIAPTDVAERTSAWSHDNGGGEATVGLHWSVTGDSGRFVTVLAPPGLAVSGGPAALTVGDALVAITPDGRLSVRRGAETTAVDAVELQRSQGSVGLFLPDAGYPFGPVPAWLEAQRSGGSH